MRRRTSPWAWLWVGVAALYFLLPLYATLDFSLRMQRGTLSLLAYERSFADPRFLQSFFFSLQMAVATIVASLGIIVPTAYWVHLKLPRLKPVIEFITLLPFVIPAIVIVFGLIRIYSKPVTIFDITILPPLTGSEITTNFLLIMGYTVLSLPYMYRAVDNGLRAMDVRTLTEAGQSLGASWITIMFRIILPNLRAALLSGALLTVAIVVGELTLANFLARPAFGPYLALLGNSRAYEPAALAIISFLLTWAVMVLVFFVTRGREEGQVVGAH